MSVPPAAPPPPAPLYSAQPHQPPLYSAQPMPQQPYRYAPPPPPVPPVPPRRGPGATTVGVTVALALFVVAGVLIAQRAGWLDRPTLATAAALIVVIFGVAIIVSGLRGRSSGVLGFLAVVAMIAAVPITTVARSDWPSWSPPPGAIQGGSGTTVISDRDTAEKGVQISFGDATVDLTDVPLEDDALLTVPIQLGAGDFEVWVPQGADVSAQVDVGAGQVRWIVGGDDATYSGLGVHQENLGDTTDPQLHLQVSVGAGDVTIQEMER